MTVIARLQSLEIALDFLESQTVWIKRLFCRIFSKAACLMKSCIALVLISNNISRLIGIGEIISEFKDKFANCITFKTRLMFLIMEAWILEMRPFW
jgi:alanine racemase